MEKPKQREKPWSFSEEWLRKIRESFPADRIRVHEEASPAVTILFDANSLYRWTFYDLRPINGCSFEYVSGKEKWNRRSTNRVFSRSSFDQILEKAKRELKRIQKNHFDSDLIISMLFTWAKQNSRKVSSCDEFNEHATYFDDFGFFYFEDVSRSILFIPSVFSDFQQKTRFYGFTSETADKIMDFLDKNCPKSRTSDKRRNTRR